VTVSGEEWSGAGSNRRPSAFQARTGGRSKTWRRSTPVTGRPARATLHRPQQPGSCTTSRSGRATCANLVPLCAPCPPACARSSSAATAAQAWPALRSMAAWRSSAASAPAGPPAQRSAPAPAPARRVPAQAPRAATPPAPRAPHTAAGLDQRARQDTTVASPDAGSKQRGQSAAPGCCRHSP
jgi:hypothetical protein